MSKRGVNNMIKKITITDKYGKLLLKISYRDDDYYDMVKNISLQVQEIQIDVRDEKNHKLIFGGW